MNLADSRMDYLRGCLATLSVLIVRIALQEYSKIHEKAYKCIVCVFEKKLLHFSVCANLFILYWPIKALPYHSITIHRKGM